MSKELLKYKWGFGIEHEMHIFHIPTKKQKGNIEDFILFDAHSAVERIFKDRERNKISITDDEYKFLKSVPFELSGRMCNNKWVIERVPVQMPEFITSKPFCSINDNRDLLNMTMEIVESKERFYKLILKDKTTQKLIKNYGEMTDYPFGMTRYLKCPKEEVRGKYIFSKNKEGKDILRPEYNGSYHITMTLPHKENISNSEFIKIHQNFANQLQWLEPLLLTAYFSGDEYAPGSIKKRVRGSFRVMIIGWGNLAGSDIRLFNKGIGRYAKTKTFWRENLKFEDVDKLKPCYKPSKMALAENAITSLSSDFRTFGSTNPERPEHRESGIGMTKPNGIEFRIFDQFSDKYIDSLVRLVSLVAENSRVTQTKGYVYKNKSWIKALHAIMRDGYKARISKSYIKLLREKLGLKIKTTSVVAYDIFKKIYEELWEKNIHGKWSMIFNNMEKFNAHKVSSIIPQINKNAWQFAFMLKANRHPVLMRHFNFFSDCLNSQKSVSMAEFSELVVKVFGNNWKNDIEDIAYFYDSLFNNDGNKICNLVKNKNGSIKSITMKANIHHYDNFNESIMDYIGEGLNPKNFYNL